MQSLFWRQEARASPVRGVGALVEMGVGEEREEMGGERGEQGGQSGRRAAYGGLCRRKA